MQHEGLQQSVPAFNDLSAVDLEHSLCKVWGDLGNELYPRENALLARYTVLRGWDADPFGKEAGTDDLLLGAWCAEHANQLRTLIHHAYGTGGDATLRATLEDFVNGAPHAMDQSEFEALLDAQAHVFEDTQEKARVLH